MVNEPLRCAIGVGPPSPCRYYPTKNGSTHKCSCQDGDNCKTRPCGHCKKFALKTNQVPECSPQDGSMWVAIAKHSPGAWDSEYIASAKENYNADRLDGPTLTHAQSVRLCALLNSDKEHITVEEIEDAVNALDAGEIPVHIDALPDRPYALEWMQACQDIGFMSYAEYMAARENYAALDNAAIEFPDVLHMALNGLDAKAVVDRDGLEPVPPMTDCWLHDGDGIDLSEIVCMLREMPWDVKPDPEAVRRIRSLLDDIQSTSIGGWQ